MCRRLPLGHVSRRSNVVPSFKLDSDEAIDLRGMPPAVAEVYVLTGALGMGCNR